MAAIEMTRGIAAPTGLLGRVFANTIGALVAWNDARATRVALARLSDRELDDIGLCRGDINKVVENL